MHERIQNILDDIEKSGEKVRNINVFLNDPGTTVVINYSKGEGRQTEPIDLVRRDQHDQTLNTLAARDRVEGSGVPFGDVPQQGGNHEPTDSGHVSPNLHNPCGPQGSDADPVNEEEECESDDDDNDYNEAGGEEEKEEDCDAAAADDDNDGDDDDEEEEDATQQRTIAAAHNSGVDRSRDYTNCDNDEEEENAVEYEDDEEEDNKENMIKDNDDFGENDVGENFVEDEDDFCDNDDEEENVVDDEDDVGDSDEEEENVFEDEDDDCDNDGDEEYMDEDEGDDDADVNDDDDDSSRQGAEQSDSSHVDPRKEIDKRRSISFFNNRMERFDRSMESRFKSVTGRSGGSPDSKPSTSEKDCVSDSFASASGECNRYNGIMTVRGEEKLNLRESSGNEEFHPCTSEGASESRTVIAKGDLEVDSTTPTQRPLEHHKSSFTKTPLCEENSDKAQSSTSGNDIEFSERAKESEPEETDASSEEYIKDVLYGIQTECTREELAHRIRDPTRNKEMYRVVQSKYTYSDYRDLYINCVFDDVVVVFSYKRGVDYLYRNRYCKLYDSWWERLRATDASILDSTHPLYPMIIERAMGAVDADLKHCQEFHPLPPPPAANDDEDGEADAANDEDGKGDDDDTNDYE